MGPRPRGSDARLGRRVRTWPRRSMTSCSTSASATASRRSRWRPPQPDLDVVGVEVHTPGVVTVLDAIEHRGLHHIRVVHGDLLPFLDRVAPESFAVVRIYFPDPWTKRRNFHRRLVAPDVVAALTDRLRVGGTLHLATDIADYAESMRQVCDAEPRLSGGVIDRPDWRPLTRFEQRGLDAGRSPTDLLYTRTTAGPSLAAGAVRRRCRSCGSRGTRTRSSRRCPS